jgi:phosphoglycolate phosphatase
MRKTIVFDFDGTIVKKDVANEAAHRRAIMLGIETSKDEINEKQKTHAHYKDAKEAIKDQTDITDEKKLTILMTNFFQTTYLEVVKEEKENCLYSEMREVIETLSKDYDLAIASTLRQDIIEPTLEILSLKKYFQGVYANTPDLYFSKEDLVKEATINHKSCIYMIGDREEDIEAGKKQGLKTIHVNWGHAKTNGNIKNPKEIIEIIENNENE